MPKPFALVPIVMVVAIVWLLPLVTGDTTEVHVTNGSGVDVELTLTQPADNSIPEVPLPQKQYSDQLIVSKASEVFTGFDAANSADITISMWVKGFNGNTFSIPADRSIALADSVGQTGVDINLLKYNSNDVDTPLLTIYPGVAGGNQGTVAWYSTSNCKGDYIDIIQITKPGPMVHKDVTNVQSVGYLLGDDCQIFLLTSGENPVYLEGGNGCLNGDFIGVTIQCPPDNFSGLSER